MQKFIEDQTTIFTSVYQSIREYAIHRQEQIKKFETEIQEIKQERLSEIDFKEKDRLTEKLSTKSQYNPSTYLPPYENAASPYFGSFSIDDEDKSITRNSFLIGKQSLFDKDNNVVVVDWRKASISSLFYEYEAGEDYFETIGGREREGVVTEKNRYLIKSQNLLRIESSRYGVIEKHGDDWLHDENKRKINSTDIKESSGDFNLCDVTALISRDQFRLITEENKGALIISGSAGFGKSTIAVARASWLFYNYPEEFQPKKSLVLMFNRALRDYVKSNVADLLGETPIETFNSWAQSSLRVLGVKHVQFKISNNTSFDKLKKASGMALVVEEYVKTAKTEKALDHLFGCYSNKELIYKHLSQTVDNELLDKFITYYQERKKSDSNDIAFSDAGVLLRIFQLKTKRSNPGVVNIACNYWNHVIVDECQDLSKIELDSIYDAADEKKSVSIAVDINQRILDFLDQDGYEKFKMSMEKTGGKFGSLDVSYRSTKQIIEVANKVIVEEITTDVPKSGDLVFFGKYRNQQESLESLKNIIQIEKVKHPGGLIAVICKYKKSVDYLFSELKGIEGVVKGTLNLVFKPGTINIVNAHRVKGIEFSSVIAWNVSIKNYNISNKNDRNCLYVVLTRAAERLYVLTHSEPVACLKEYFQEPLQ